MTNLAKPGKRKLIFDGDGSQFTDTGQPCSLCNTRMTADNGLVFIRVREKLQTGTRELGFVCPDCVARMFLQVTRLDLWRHVSGNVVRAIQRLLRKRWKGSQEPPARKHVLVLDEHNDKHWED